MNQGIEILSSYIANCVLDAFLCFTAIVLNIITIHAIRKTSSLPNPLKTLLVSLAVSDLGVGLLAQPMYITYLVALLKSDTDEHDPSLQIRSFAFLIPANLLSYASFFGVVILSADRFLAITLHLRYTEFVTNKCVNAVAIFIWLLSAVLSLIRLWMPVNVVFLIYASVEVVCVLIATFLNYKIYLAVQGHRNQIEALHVQRVWRNGEMSVNAARLRKSAAGAFYIYLVFMACYLPQISMKIAVIISGHNDATRQLYYFAWTIVFLNSSLNPLIYCWKLRHIRQSVVNTIRNVLPCQR